MVVSSLFFLRLFSRSLQLRWSYGIHLLSLKADTEFSQSETNERTPLLGDSTCGGGYSRSTSFTLGSSLEDPKSPGIISAGGA